jgi:hypothetical protein
MKCDDHHTMVDCEIDAGRLRGPFMNPTGKTGYDLRVGCVIRSAKTQQ